MAESNPRLITPFGILSYPHLVIPQPPDKPGAKPKYDAVVIFPANTDLKAMKEAAFAAGLAKFGATYKGVSLADAFRLGHLRWPFRNDWEKKGYPENSVFIAARTTLKPQCILQDKRTLDPSEIEEHFYPGAWVRASVTAFAYDDEKNKGVGWQLNSLQKVKDGERLDSRINAEDEFDTLASSEPMSGATNALDGLL